MFFAFRRLERGAAVVWLAAACGSCSGSATSATAERPAPIPAGANTSTASLTFDPTASPCPDGRDACLLPAASIELGVTYTGADATIAFALEGAYADASLGQAGVEAVGGHASVTLHAPMSAATFSVRASAPGAADALLSVSVSGSGFATIHVISAYSGKRPVPVVVSQALVRTTCSARSNLPLDPTGPWATGDLVNVPAESHVAVETRIEEYAAGCADVASLLPGVTTDVTVSVFDLPLALDQTDLESQLTFVPDTNGAAGWSSMLDAAIAQAESAFLPRAATSEGDALLDAMQAAVPSASQPAFEASRDQGQWNIAADEWLSQHAPSMASRVASWLGSGKTSALGALAAHLGPGQSAGYATVTLETFAGLDAEAAGLSLAQGGQFTWTADADDTLHLAGVVHLSPSALSCASADVEAAASVSGATGVADALSTQIDCAGLATSLVGSDTSYPGCDASCTANLCRAGLAAMWTAARGASNGAGAGATIQITASAAASVAADPTLEDTVTAAPARFVGTWVGEVSPTGAAQFAMQGAASGQNAELVK